MSFYNFVRKAVLLYGKIVYRVEFHGRENEPEGGSLVVISNHSSFSDALFTANAVKRELTFIAKESLARHKFLAWVLKRCHAITIKRGEGDMQAVRSACSVLSGGGSLGVYPQGTRMPGSAPKPEEAMAGIGLIASRCKATFLPVTICFGKNKKFKPCAFGKVRVYVGKPITYEEYSSINEHPNSHEIAEYAFSKVCEDFERYN